MHVAKLSELNPLAVCIGLFATLLEYISFCINLCPLVEVLLRDKF